jgi:C-terminal processing protease CtpA/Prc
MELAKSLHDGHSQLTSNNPNAMIDELVFGKYTVPFYCQIINGTVVVRKISNDSLCKKAGIKRGDIILKIDNTPVEKQIQIKRKYISASNNLSENHYLSWYILYGQTPIVHLTVKRGDSIFTTSIKRISSSENFQKNWRDIINYSIGNSVCKKLDDSTLLIYAARIWSGNIDTVKSMIKQSKAVIFDVRNYPNNDAFYSITDPFLSQPKTINYSTVALPAFPGLFKWKLNPNKIGHSSDSAFKGKVIILCDERTQSQGEYSCMTLQTIPNSITIGTQTAGADGVVTLIPIGGGLSISYSGYGMYYPDKTQTQRIGIKIDIQVRETIEAIKNNKDEILDRALQYIRNN